MSWLKHVLLWYRMIKTLSRFILKKNWLSALPKTNLYTCYNFLKSLSTTASHHHPKISQKHTVYKTYIIKHSLKRLRMKLLRAVLTRVRTYLGPNGERPTRLEIILSRELKYNYCFSNFTATTIVKCNLLKVFHLDGIFTGNFFMHTI